MRAAACIVLFASVVAPVSAAVYKWVDEAGVTQYTDLPGPGREKVEIAPVQTYRSPGVPVARPAEPTAGEAFAGYGEFVITKPADDATIRNNAGDVSVGIRLQPTLRKTDRIKIYLDGAALSGGGRGTAFTLPNIGRGTHRLQVAIIDGAGKELLRSATVTFHLLRVARKKRAR